MILQTLLMLSFQSKHLIELQDIDHIKNANDAEILVGGNYDKSKGYFIEPTIVSTTDPKFKTMCEEYLVLW